MIVRNPVVSAVARIIHGTHVRKGGYLAGIGGQCGKGSTIGDLRTAGNHIIGVCFAAVAAHTVLIVMTDSIHRLGITVTAGTAEGLHAFCGTGRIRGHFAIVVDMVLTIIFEREEADSRKCATIFQCDGHTLTILIQRIAGYRHSNGLSIVTVFGVICKIIFAFDRCARNGIYTINYCGITVSFIILRIISQYGFSRISYIHSCRTTGNSHNIVGSLMNQIPTIAIINVAHLECRVLEYDILRGYFFAIDLDA